MKKFSKIKRIFTILLIFLISINSFAAIVSDNDGSAFVTKAEFDALKNSFNKQIDDYNTSIDGKIDGAIASYLAGIKMVNESEQISIINQVTPRFLYGKAFDRSNLGQAIKYYISIAYMCVTGGLGTGQTKNTVQVSYFYEGSADTWYFPTWKNLDSADHDILYQLNEQTYGSTTYYKIKNLLYSSYTAVVGGAAGGGRGWDSFSAPANESYKSLAPKTVTKGAKEDFGMVFDTIEVRNMVTGADCGGTRETLTGTWGFSDEELTDNTLNYLAGDVLADTQINCVLDAEICKFGDCYRTVQADMAAARLLTYKGQYSHEKGSSAGGYGDCRLSLECYRHKVRKISQTDIIHDALSTAMNQPIKYYEGCPMFTADTTGIAKVTLKFENSVGSNTVYAIDNKKFNNVKVVGGAGAVEGCTETVWKAANNEFVTLQFNAKQNETYWIKALPDNGNTKITSVKLVIEKE